LGSYEQDNWQQTLLYVGMYTNYGRYYKQTAAAVIVIYKHKQMMATKTAMKCMLDSSALYYAHNVS
jgi:hypothetical protein